MATPEGVAIGTLDISTAGDVILLVGDPNNHDGETTKLRVSSTILSYASPVFQAMFRPHFLEGRELKATTRGPVEILLPDDDPEALTMICQVAHLRNDDVPGHINLPVLLQVARLADKYDCSEALRYVTRQWMKTLSRGGDSLAQSGADLSLVAFLLRDNVFLESLGLELLLKVEDVSLVGDRRDLPLVLERYLDYVQLRKHQIYLNVGKIIDARIQEVTEVCSVVCEKSCTFKQDFTLALLREFSHRELWPTEKRHSVPLHSLLLNTSDFEFIPLMALRCCSASTGCVYWKILGDPEAVSFCHKLTMELLRSLDPWRESVSTHLPCLPCVLENNIKGCAHKRTVIKMADL